MKTETLTDKAVHDAELQKLYSKWAKKNNNGGLTGRDWELVRLGANYEINKKSATNEALLSALKIANEYVMHMKTMGSTGEIDNDILKIEEAIKQAEQ